MEKAKSPESDKSAALRHHTASTPGPTAVTDPVFRAGAPFFDAEDLVQANTRWSDASRQMACRSTAPLPRPDSLVLASTVHRRRRWPSRRFVLPC